MKRLKYHEFRKENKILAAEEHKIIDSVRQAVNSCPNPSIIGNNGEVQIRDFLKRYLPPCFAVETGHYVGPSKNISPQIDVMILDSRFPVLARNSDNSVLAIGHSVISCISVKSTIGKREIDEIGKWATKNERICSKIHEKHRFSNMTWRVIGIRSKINMGTLMSHFFRATSNAKTLSLYIIRSQIRKNENSGLFLWWENYDSRASNITRSHLKNSEFPLK